MGSLRGELSYPPNDIHLPEGVKRALRTIISDTSSTRSVSAGHALLTVHVFGDSACCTALESQDEPDILEDVRSCVERHGLVGCARAVLHPPYRSSSSATFFVGGKAEVRARTVLLYVPKDEGVR